MRRFHVLTNRAKLHCSDVRHQTLKLIHYGSVVVADGRIERDPTSACLPGRRRESRDGRPRQRTRTRGTSRARAPRLAVVIDFITLTLNHGVFAVRAASGWR
jgi:hypothetical protein